MPNTSISKEGKRFDWYPLLDLQFLDDCIVKVSELTVSTLRAKSTRGVNAKKQLDSFKGERSNQLQLTRADDG